MQFQRLIFFPRSTHLEVRPPSKSNDASGVEVRLFQDWLPVCLPSPTVSIASTNPLSKFRECLVPGSVQSWRLYPNGWAAAFRTGSLRHFQILFARKACQRIPITRDQLHVVDASVPAAKKGMYAVH